jgi:hypothetical protein
MTEATAVEMPVEGTETLPPVVPAIEATQSVAPIVPPATSSLQQLLDQADAKELRSHPRIAGIIGSENQRAIQAEKQRIKVEEGVAAAKAAEAELLQLAQDDPVAFSEKWLTDKQREKIQGEISDLRDSTRRDFATAIGRAFRAIPEWGDLTPDEHTTIAKAILNQPDDEVLPLFNRTALELVAVKQREAIRQEEAAKLMQNGAAPDLARPKSAPGRLNFSKMSDREFAEYWDKNHK